MRASGTSYAVSLNLARDRARRDHRAADAWRRLHAEPDDESHELETDAAHGLHAALARLFGALLLRRTGPTT
jgi:hypothetical protein